MEPVKFVALDRRTSKSSPPICRMPRSRSPTSSGGRRRSGWWSGLNRFDWQAAKATVPGAAPLPFGAAVRARDRPASARNVNPAGKDAVLNLLAVEFAETDAPAGVVTLMFSGGASAAARGRVPGGRAGRSRAVLGGRSARPCRTRTTLTDVRG